MAFVDGSTILIMKSDVNEHGLGQLQIACDQFMAVDSVHSASPPPLSGAKSACK